MSAIITLTSDFGPSDAYVAAMKGVVLGINPGATIVDISHSIEPQSILQAAFVLSAACDSFPAGTIHLAVVDPGVGTERRGIVLKTPRACFVAPDNGVLTYAAQAYVRNGALVPGVQAFALTNRKYWRSPVSSTFHGRDIFAPVAAHLSVGVPVSELGDAVDSVQVLPVVQPERRPDGSLEGSVIHIDRFGNLITNIRCAHLTGKPWKTVVEIARQRIDGLSRTYAEGEGLLALTDSHDRLEIAWKNGSACRFLGASIGDAVVVRQE